MSQARRAEVRSRAIRGAVSVGLRNLAVRGIGLVGVVVLSRILDKHSFGLLAFGLTIRALSDLIATGGLAAGLVRRAAPPSEDELGAMVFFQAGVSALLVAVLALCGLVWGDAAFVGAIMAGTLVVSAFRVPSVVVLERSLDWGLVARAEVSETMIYTVVAILAAAVGLDIWGVAAASVVGGLAGTVILLRAGPVGFVRPRPHVREISSLLRFGVRFQAVGLVAVIRDQGLNLVVVAVGGIVMLGTWSIAYRLLQVILLLLQSLWRVSYPAMARALEVGDSADLLVGRVLQVSTTLVAPLAAVLAGCAPALIHVLFSDTWAAAAPILPWGAAALATWGPVSTACTGFLQTKDDISRFLVVVIGQALVWFAVTIALMPSIGAEAAGTGMFVGSIAYCAGIAYLMRRHLRLSFVRIMWAPITASGFAAGAAAMTVDAFGTALPSLMLSIAVAVGCCGLILAVIRASDLRAVVHLVRRLPSGAVSPS